MPRSRAHLEINSFVRGLVTEASPLTFPKDASLDEDNFVLNIDGTRQRRLGIDYEANSSIITSVQQIPAARSTQFSTFNWENVGGDPLKEFIVVQVGKLISFFDAREDVISANKIGADFEVGTGDEPYSFATVDGVLVVASNTRLLSIFEYDGTTIIVRTELLKIRDQFGVEDIVDSKDLFDPEFLSLRVDSERTDSSGTPIVPPPPGILTDTHLYNLRNQSWGFKTLSGSSRTVGSFDPILIFEGDLFKYPSNSDVLHSGVFIDPADTLDPPRERLYPYKIEEGNTESPSGSFVIDALNRGASRETAYSSAAIVGGIELGSLPADKTPNGATCLAEFSGRVFYSGFKGEVIDGDSRSPKLSSYILFSRLVNHLSDITLCYQEGDPTNKEQPDIIATDGGFIRIQGAYGIKRLVSLGPSLIVFAENGVWAIRGDAGRGFSAVEYEVTQLTDRGCLSATSVVTVDNSAFYWSKDGIYVVSPNEFQEYSATNITHETIRKFYDNISEADKVSSQGTFDSFQKQVNWTIGGTLQSTSNARQLRFDTRLGAFSPATIKNASGSLFPRIVGAVQVPPFHTGTSIDKVVVEGVQVQAGGIDVQVSNEVQLSRVREVKYLTVTGENSSGNPLYTFSSFTDLGFLDWKTFDTVGTDANAFLLTGHLTGGDSSRVKYVPNIFFHFKKTEDGFSADGDDFKLDNQSSCLVQAQWEWSNSSSSGRFGREFQAYRHSRHYMPEDISDTYNNGFETVVTRNRLRGKGRALSLLLKTEAGKDLQLIGWGQEMLINERA